MTRLLAIETATEACSAALFDGDETLSRYLLAPRQHAALILPMIEELLAEAQWQRSSLDAIAYGRGPGSFTGVRLAASVTQGIAYGLDLPVARVSTLQAIAQRAARELGASKVFTAIDARMQEVYWGKFIVDMGEMRPLGEEQVCAPEAVSLPDDGRWIGAGTGWKTYESVLRERAGELLDRHEADFFPHAMDVAWLGRRLIAAGEGVSAAQAIPVYLRDNVASKPQPR